MKILMLSTDKEIFQPGSDVQKRMIEYAGLADQLHLVVYTKKSDQKSNFQIGRNLFVYPTNSPNKIFYFRNGYKIAKKIIFSKRNEWLITAQDPFETGFLGYLLSRQLKVALQIQAHTDFLNPYFKKESLKNRFRVSLGKWIVQKADCVRVVSERIKNSIIACLPSLSSRIAVLPIFVDIEKIKQSNLSTNLHKKYPNHDFIILMASRLAREKNIGLAISAMAEIVERFPKSLLLIVGDGPEKNKLEAEIGKLHLQNNIKMEQSTQDLASYYKTSDLFLLTSDYEGYGRVAVEAAAAGLPVLMTDVGVALGKTFPVRDRAALVKNLAEFVESRETLKAVIAGQKRFLENWPSKKEYLEKYRKLFESCQKKTRVLFITQKIDKDDDTLGVYHRWVEGLSKKFEKISVICLYQGKENLPSNVSVYSLGKERGVGRVKYLFNFYKYIWKLRDEYNVVFVHMNPEYVILAGWLWKLMGKRLVFWYAHYLGTWKLRLASIFPDKIVTSVRLAYPFNSSKLEVLQQGIDTGRFKPGDRLEKTNNNSLKILFLGRIAPVKHVDILIRAFAAALPQIGDASLTIVGAPTPGKSHELAYYGEIKKIVSELGVANRVEFQASVPNYETPKIYNQHDLFVNLTNTGSFDKTTLEAMACGLPVLVSNKAFLEIFPQSLQPLLIFRERNVDDLTEKIARLASLTTSNQLVIGKAMRQLIEEKHSLAGLIEKLYESLSL